MTRPNNVVTITVSGPVGSGKSAIIGEMEIALMAIGVPVQHRNAAAWQSEKNMTHAKWQDYLEMYQPMVTFVERIEKSPPAHCYTITVRPKWSERLAAAWSITFGFNKWTQAVHK